MKNFVLEKFKSKRVQMTLIYFIPVFIVFGIFTFFIFKFATDNLYNLDEQMAYSNESVKGIKDYIKDATGADMSEDKLSNMTLADIDKEIVRLGGKPISSPDDPLYYLTMPQIMSVTGGGFFVVESLDEATQKAQNQKIKYLDYKEIKKIQDRMYNTFVLGILSAVGLISLFLAALAYYLGKRAVMPLEDAIEKQKRFVSDSSHELKTPLALMKSEAELLLLDVKNNTSEDYVKFAKNVSNDIDRMNGLIDSLLQLARNDQKKIEIKKDKINLNEAIEQVCGNFKVLSDKKNIKLENSIEKNIVVNFDINIFYQVVSIILDNAIKYTKEGGSVRFFTNKDKSHIKLYIQDSGVGIPKKELDKIFDRFYRVSKDRHEKGYGLGLAIAKELITTQGSKLNIESIEGKGTTLIVTIK